MRLHFAMTKVILNKYLFFLVGLLAPLQILDFDIPALSVLYLCFLILIIDVKFWYNLIVYFKVQRKTALWLLYTA